MDATSLVALLARLLALGAQYNQIISDIRANHPDVWDKVRASYGSALAEFEASTIRRFGRENDRLGGDAVDEE